MEEFGDKVSFLPQRRKVFSQSSQGLKNQTADSQIFYYESVNLR